MSKSSFFDKSKFYRFLIF